MVYIHIRLQTKVITNVNFADISQSVHHEHKTINTTNEKGKGRENVHVWDDFILILCVASCGFCGAMDRQQAGSLSLVLCDALLVLWYIQIEEVDRMQS